VIQKDLVENVRANINRFACSHVNPPVNTLAVNPMAVNPPGSPLNAGSKPFNPANTPATGNQQPSTTATVQSQPATTASNQTKGGVMLQTATASAISYDGSTSIPVKIIFDSGSQRSYVSDHLKTKLGLKSQRSETLHLNTFGEKRFRRQKCELLQLKLCASNDEQVTIEALNFPVICSPVSATINLENHPHLNGIQLADKSNVSDP
jgi:hypothetical protein